MLETGWKVGQTGVVDACPGWPLSVMWLRLSSKSISISGPTKELALM